MSLMPTRVSTIPYMCQNPGTSGLRKKVTVFQQKNYTENFIQSILNFFGEDVEDCSLIVGGDGRYFSRDAIQIIISIAAANQVGKLTIGRSGFLSTPAASNLIRLKNAIGGIILTASHNSGGPDGDFGIKLNTQNGGPASDSVSNCIYKISLSLSSYLIVSDIKCDIDNLCTYTYNIDGRKFMVEIIDPVVDYVRLMKDIFDFDSIRKMLKGSHSRKPISILIDSRNGITGPYVQQIFVNELGASQSSVFRTTPLPDFGGVHPDPNLTYAKELTEVMNKKGNFDFLSAFDGDGDRNLILGKNALFVSPSDSLAVIAANLEHIPFFRITGIKGFARSMPTAAAIDQVSSRNSIKCYEVPVGWKHFQELMDANKISLCGEESFGTGSDHVREKDGIWAALAWLQILACEKSSSVEEILKAHWRKFGRNFFIRYDYENIGMKECQQVFNHISAITRRDDFIGTQFSSDDKIFTVKSVDSFDYQDPIGCKVNEIVRIFFTDDSRILFRKSGTDAIGTTIRIYIDIYETSEDRINKTREEILQTLTTAALKISQIRTITGRDRPSLIT